MSDNAPDSPQHEEPKVKVSDRRRFTAEGQERDPSELDPPPDAGGTAGDGAAAAEPATSSEAGGTAAGSQEQTRTKPIPPASFELLVFSLAIQAQMELGLGGSAEGQLPDLDMARHAIDLLAILQQKTKGNLTLEEQRLLENTLTELRFRYVQAVEQINKQVKP